MRRDNIETIQVLERMVYPNVFGQGYLLNQDVVELRREAQEDKGDQEECMVGAMVSNRNEAKHM